MKQSARALEKYLLQVHHLQTAQGVVHVTDVACSLGVSKPSVSRAVRQLAAEGLLVHARYGPVALTQRGRRAALELEAKRSAAECFLTGVLGIQPKRAEREAYLWSGAISAATAEKLRRAARGEVRV